MHVLHLVADGGGAAAVALPGFEGDGGWRQDGSGSERGESSTKALSSPKLTFGYGVCSASARAYT